MLNLNMTTVHDRGPQVKAGGHLQLFCRFAIYQKMLRETVDRELVKIKSIVEVLGI